MGLARRARAEVLAELVRRASGRPDLVEKQFEHPDSDAGDEVAAVFKERTRDEWTAFAGEHDCCLEPMLDLDEALDSELVDARGMVVELDQPGIGPVQAGRLPDQAVAHAGRIERRGPGAREQTPTRCCAAIGYRRPASRLREEGVV